MKKRRMIRVVATGVLLALVTLVSSAIAVSIPLSAASEPILSGDAQVRFEELTDAGFPEDYALRLTGLSLLHPSWEFLPLDVSSTDARYTWEYVVGKETEDPSANLIPKSDTYKAYRHETNETLYDSGYYQASGDTVKYFMDPRNFLNEADIFQFYDLSYRGGDCLAATEAVLKGTFMENKILENGQTYAANFCEIGAALGIHPVYLAVKARQEQGTAGTSPIISGKCGTLLWEYYRDGVKTSPSGAFINAPDSGYTEAELRALDGYYNLFNVSASGTGQFEICLGAMRRAAKGSPEMSSAWGGSPSWNTVPKSIWGGASLLKQNYIDRYQPNIYLQKFNVDGHVPDRNFWAQYMQSVSGAMSESRTLYQSVCAAGALDCESVFLIPVYKDMPEVASPDPANAACSYLATADTKYSYTVTLPSDGIRADASPLWISKDYYEGERVVLSGTLSHTDGALGAEYRLDGGAWKPLSLKNGEWKISLSPDLPENSSHILTMRGIADQRGVCRNFLAAVIYLNILPAPEATVTLRVANTGETVTAKVGSPFVLPACDAPDFAGWIGSDGTFLPSGAEFVLGADVTYTAFFPRFETLRGASLYPTDAGASLRFSIAQPVSDAALTDLLPAGALAVRAEVEPDGTIPVGVTVAADSAWRYFHADTGVISPERYDEPLRIRFTLRFAYTDGTDAEIGIAVSDSRSVRQIAAAALEDPAHPYSETLICALTDLLKPEN